jgi:hypothetical protein
MHLTFYMLYLKARTDPFFFYFYCCNVFMVRVYGQTFFEHEIKHRVLKTIN